MHALEGGTRLLRQRRQVDLVGALGEQTDVGCGLPHVANRVHQLLLVGRGQQLVDTLRCIVKLGQQPDTLVRQARHQAGAHGDTARLLVTAGQRSSRGPGIVKLNKGQPRHALKAQRGEGCWRDGCRTVHNNADQHVAHRLRVQRDGLHAPHRHALVPNRCLNLQPGDALAAGDFERPMLAGVARQPGRQRHQQGGDHQYKGSGGNRV